MIDYEKTILTLCFSLVRNGINKEDVIDSLYNVMCDLDNHAPKEPNKYEEFYKQYVLALDTKKEYNRLNSMLRNNKTNKQKDKAKSKMNKAYNLLNKIHCKIQRGE